MFSLTRHVFQTLHKPLRYLDNAARSLCTNTTLRNGTSCQRLSILQNPQHSPVFSSVSKDNSVNNLNVQSVRSYMRVYYKPSAWKRHNKHNLEKRLSTPGGIEVLWRRVLKGRHNLAVYERILPNTVDCKILAKHQTRFRKHPLTKQKLPKPGLF